MARDLSRVKTQYINAVKGIYSAATYGANATVMSIDELQNLIQSLLSDYNRGQAAWADLNGLMGGAEARNLLSQTINSPPADIGAALSTVSADLRAILTAYENQFGAGTANREFSYTVNSGQLEGGFSDINVSTPLLTSLNTLCTTLQNSVEAITPVS